MSNVIDLATEDNLQYTFYPVSNGYTAFKVRAANDAHIALTTGPMESDPMVEIFIGGWGNTKSVIRRDRTKPEQVEVETPLILHPGEFRGFWIRWDGGVISAGKEGESLPFISWSDPAPFPIGFVGFCTGWGASGTWKIEDGPTFETSDKLEYQFHPIVTGSLSFEYKGPHNCHVSLTSGPREADPMYELIIGGWENKQSVLRYCRQKPDKVIIPTPGIVNPGEFRKFLIQWRNGRVILRQEDGNVLIDWSDPNPFPITHFGVRTGWGARGQWKISTAGVSTGGYPSAPSAPAAYTSMPTGGGGSPVWVPSAGGQIPPSAIVGGQDGEPLYVIRARHEGALLPGKLACSHGVAYVSWGGCEHGKTDYEVLCGGSPNWVPTNGANVPPNAFPGGETEEGEPLFIGRVNHEGSVTIGKIQTSHGVCYIPYGGQELGFQDYEALVI